MTREEFEAKVRTHAHETGAQADADLIEYMMEMMYNQMKVYHLCLICTYSALAPECSQESRNSLAQGMEKIIAAHKDWGIGAMLDEMEEEAAERLVKKGTPS